MKKIIVYPGTFDPMTFGHIDLIERALHIVDKMVIAVAANTNKSPLFTLEERVNLAQQIFADHKNIEVVGFNGLLIDLMRQLNANIILRGLRVVSDFDYEFQLAGMNRHLAPDIETLFLMPAENYTYISSRFVREIALLGGDVASFVPEIVVAAFNEKFRGD